MDHCFPGASTTLTDALKVALRVVHLHSSRGDLRLRVEFEDAMRKHPWNASNRRALVCEPPYPVGSKRHWGLVLFANYSQVEGILNRIGAPS